MDNIRNRGRGRPVGTGLDDGPTLNKMADIMVANPAMRPTTAMRRAIDKPGPSLVRRLQVKWKAGSAEYLAAAHARRAAASAPVPARRVSAAYSPRMSRQLMQAQRKMQEALGPGLQAAQAMMTSPAMLAAQEAARRLQESPAMRALEEYRNSPTMRALEEYQNSPTMRAIRELLDSPAMRAMRELQDSPTMRAAREAAQEVAKIQRLISGSGF